MNYETRIAKAFDVPPWLTFGTREPRFSRLRWRLRKLWPGLVWK